MSEKYPRREQWERKPIRKSRALRAAEELLAEPLPETVSTPQTMDDKEEEAKGAA